MIRQLLFLCSLLVLVTWSVPAHSDDAYVRVISQYAPVHTGPGARYRKLYRAERGETFAVEARSTVGYWFRVRLEDGTQGWILGDLLFPYEVTEDSSPGFWTRIGRALDRTLLGPSPLPQAQVEISISAGILDKEGIFLLRPAWILDKFFAVEAFAGLSPRAQDSLYLGGLGWTLRLIPGAAIGPYVNVGFGAARLSPKGDNFTQDPRNFFALSAGGGFEITLKKQVTIRLDFRNWTLFDPDEASNGQEYSGGFAVFF